jgi:hypothetical protein
MATQEELIAEYVRVNAQYKAHEAGLEKTKAERKELARQLFELNGKGHIYDLGDGVAMMIVRSKGGSYFFTPKEKWQKGGRKKKGAVKKKIVGMQVVDEADVQPKKGRVIQAEATLTGKGSMPMPDGAAVKTDPPASEAPQEEPEAEVVAEPQPKQAPVEAPSEPEEDQAEIDALAAALAEIDDSE